MLKRIGSLLVMVTVMMPFLNSCDNDQNPINTFHAVVDASNSAAADAKYSIVTVFSTDNGATFTDFPKVKKGETYWVKAVNRTSEGDIELVPYNCFDVDWSASSPAPNSVTGGIAEFTMTENGDLVGKVSDFANPPYRAANWRGAFAALEDYGSQTYGPYELHLTQDASNPNRFNLDNFYDSGYEAYIEFDANGTVKFPDQITGGKPITNSSGTYDQCTGEVHITLNYDGGDWDYYLEKE